MPSQTVRLSTLLRALDRAAFLGAPVRREQTTLPNVIAIDGGVPIKVGNDVIGGVGVSGSPGVDEPCVNAVLEKAKTQLNNCHGSARCQMQKFSSVRKFHFDPSLACVSIRSPRRRGRAGSGDFEAERLGCL